ncbi:MAG: hypothetical protein KDK34_24745, partial [Leptospiraceae bacterium]|nr:hypothetical protein [Leptospiraceae bacterium]
MKFSIQSKIFSIFVVLILAMAIVAAISAYRTRLVSKELDALSEIYIPLTESVESIDAHVLEQQVHFNRVFRMYETYPRNYDSIETELVGFQARSDHIADQLSIAHELIQMGITEENPVIDQVELARAQVMLENIEQEHHDFEIHSE